MRKIENSENVRVLPGMVTGRIGTNILFYLFKSSLIKLQVCIIVMYNTTQKAQVHTGTPAPRRIPSEKRERRFRFLDAIGRFYPKCLYSNKDSFCSVERKLHISRWSDHEYQ